MTEPAAQLVLLDRDGVINRDSAQYIKRVEEWRPLPGSLEAIARLHAAGFRVAVVTNQSGIGRGLFDAATLEAIHAAMRDAVAATGGELAGIYVCPHRPKEGCDCRKPKPGLLLRAIAELGGGPGRVPYIGDKPSDIEAARAAGARPIGVGPLLAADPPADAQCFGDLAAAAAALIAEREAPA